MEAFLAESKGIKAMGAPYDANTVVAPARISIAKGDRVACVINLGASTAAVAVFTLNQHDAASAGNSKVLSVANPYYKKINTATSFTKVEPSVAASAYDLSTDLAANAGVVVFEVLGEDLDVANGYTHFSVSLDDTTATKLVAGLYVLGGMKYDSAHSVDL